jgi:hypothetical protein
MLYSDLCLLCAEEARQLTLSTLYPSVFIPKSLNLRPKVSVFLSRFQTTGTPTPVSDCTHKVPPTFSLPSLTEFQLCGTKLHVEMSIILFVAGC